tara:strand:- start:687 stop:992 length:306 start_codon:yes stop_codon:yes gene_type:complete
MSKAQIVDQVKVDRFLRMFPPRMKQLDNQIRLIGNCSRRSDYEWDFTDTVPTFFIVIFYKLTQTAQKFGLDVDVRINNRKIEDVYEDANDEYQATLEEQND